MLVEKPVIVELGESQPRTIPESQQKKLIKIMLKPVSKFKDNV